MANNSNWFGSNRGHWVYVPSQSEESKNIGGCLMLAIFIVGMIVYTILFAILLIPCWLAIMGVMKRRFQQQFALASLLTGLYYFTDLSLGGIVDIIYNGSSNDYGVKEGIIGGAFPAIIGILNIIGILISFVSLYEINYKLFKRSLLTYFISIFVLLIIYTFSDTKSNNEIQHNVDQSETVNTQTTTNNSDVNYLSKESQVNLVENISSEEIAEPTVTLIDIDSVHEPDESLIDGGDINYDTISELVKEGDRIEQNNNSIFSESNSIANYFIVSRDRAYFYDNQDEDKRRKSYCIKGDLIKADKIEGRWIWGSFTKDNYTSSGWLLKSDLHIEYQLEETNSGFIISNIEGLQVMIEPEPNAITLKTMIKGEVASYLGIKTQFTTGLILRNKTYNGPWYLIMMDNGIKGWVNGCCIDLTLNPKAGSKD